MFYTYIYICLNQFRELYLGICINFLLFWLKGKSRKRAKQDNICTYLKTDELITCFSYIYSKSIPHSFNCLNCIFMYYLKTKIMIKDNI